MTTHPFNVLFESSTGQYRIVECYDHHASFDDLKGDSFNPKYVTDVDPAELSRREREFEELVRQEGVYGYELQHWNPNPDCGWEHVDSCWGFVGRYTETDDRFNHYIIEELRAKIPKESNK